MKVMKRFFLISVIVLSPAIASAQHDYKAARKHIRSGDYKKAIDVCDQRIAKSPQDSEWVYQKAIAHAQLGKKSEATVLLLKSVQMGVPPGRVAADATDLLKPIAGSAIIRQILVTQQNLPIQGPMLGSVTDTSARFWVRTSKQATVYAMVHEKTRTIEPIRSAKIKTSADQDFTAVVEVTGLKPQTRYYYFIVVDHGFHSEAFDPKEDDFFYTSPPQGSSTKFSIAFGGGAGYVTKHEHMWDTIGNFKPKALLLLGDNMYSDDPTSSTMQKFCYYRRQSPTAFRKLVERTAVYSIWDDHDFGTNDCSGGPAVDSPAWKTPVWNTYKQNWVNPGYGGGEKQPGCWYDFHIGDVHFIMLDGRYYRDHKTKTMLGPVQKAWAKKTLKDSKATFKIIASPVPWEFRTKGKSKDTWNGFQGERKELFDFLAENKVDGVLLMSADRHRSDAWKIDRPNGYSLYEFNSSRLTNNHVHPEMKEAIFSYNKKQSFGLVEFDTKKDDPTVRYTAINIDGEKIHTLELKKSQLK